MELNYLIDKKRIKIKVSNKTNFFYGDNICLSQKDDITKSTNWYKKGYKICSYEKFIPFEEVKNGVNNAILKILRQQFPRRDFSNFTLEKYHKYISNEEHCNLVDPLAKRLYSSDFGFSDQLFINFIEDQLKLPLSYRPRNKDLKHWIIVRINTPNSHAFNPAHKDIYEDYDKDGESPLMVNAWVPICGVNSKTGLPLVPKSHLLKESEILRTSAGSEIDDIKYAVNCIHSWKGSNKLKIFSPESGSMLLFSSHLIHGLALNNNHDETRLSLEFRLHLSK